MILVISDRLDRQVYTVTHYLDRWGKSHRQLNGSEFPSLSKLSLEYCSNKFKRLSFTSHSGQLIDCRDVDAVWYRKPLPPQVSPNLMAEHREHAFLESRETLNSLYSALEDRYWISDLNAIRRADNKLLQLQRASSLGMSVPPTLLTNDPAEAWKFYGEHKGSVIYKPVSSSTLNLRRYKYEQPISFLRAYTTLLENYSRSDFDDVSHSPCIFQRYIDKRFELRITVVADQLFAAKIDSQANEEAKHDWRRAIHSVEYSPYELPNEIAEKCLRLVKEFGLQFGAIDMIVTPADEYVFLEVNPNGQYGWIETRTGLRISEAIARALVRGDNQVQSARSSAQTTPVKLSSS